MRSKDVVKIRPGRRLSVVIYIPKELLETSQLKVGDRVQLWVQSPKTIIITLFEAAEGEPL
jgi:bifunctional DNA-binding transcriptional regulator/antitoxin component of YhaV-PrlF toxin-antitoxin module